MIALENAEGAGRHAMRSCPLCGYRFESGAERCGGCPLNGSCGVTACPRCGYESIEKSVTVEALRRLGRGIRILFSKRRQVEEGP